MSLLHRFRLFDWLLIAAALTIAVVLTASVTSRAQGEFPPKLDAAIDRAIEADLDEGPNAGIRALFDLAGVAAEWGDDEGAAHFLAIVEAREYYDAFETSTQLRSAMDSSESPVVQAFRQRWLTARSERDTVVLGGGPSTPRNPVVDNAIEAGAVPADLTLPPEPGAFPEQTLGFVEWRTVPLDGVPTAIVGDVAFPSIGLEGEVAVRRSDGYWYPYDFTVSLKSTGRSAVVTDTHVTDVRLMMEVAAAREGWAPPADLALASDGLGFTLHLIPSDPSPAEALLDARGGVTFDARLADGRRLQLMIFFDSGVRTALDEAFAAWGLIEAAAPAE